MRTTRSPSAAPTQRSRRSGAPQASQTTRSEQPLCQRRGQRRHPRLPRLRGKRSRSRSAGSSARGSRPSRWPSCARCSKAPVLRSQGRRWSRRSCSAVQRRLPSPDSSCSIPSPPQPRHAQLRRPRLPLVRQQRRPRPSKRRRRLRRRRRQRRRRQPKQPRQQRRRRRRWQRRHKHRRRRRLANLADARGSRGDGAPLARLRGRPLLALDAAVRDHRERHGSVCRVPRGVRLGGPPARAASPRRRRGPEHAGVELRSEGGASVARVPRRNAWRGGGAARGAGEGGGGVCRGRGKCLESWNGGQDRGLPGIGRPQRHVQVSDLPGRGDHHLARRDRYA
mmetsp:Transcript_15327/g.48245  ORF Transcript_15327/g.48245 Transcript_15327/m.48245 type:complete len:337 (+) Transcript_15327:402-1412(+)